MASSMLNLTKDWFDYYSNEEIKSNNSTSLKQHFLSPCSFTPRISYGLINCTQDAL